MPCGVAGGLRGDSPPGGYQSRAWRMGLGGVRLPFLELQLRCIGWSGPKFDPPLLTGVMWSAVALMGWVYGSVLSIGCPQ